MMCIFVDFLILIVLCVLSIVTRTLKGNVRPNLYHGQEQLLFLKNKIHVSII